MNRVAATLAGLALVGVPAAIAMASSDHSAAGTHRNGQSVYERYLQNAPPSFRHNGRHCHHRNGGTDKKAPTTDENKQV